MMAVFLFQNETIAWAISPMEKLNRSLHFISNETTVITKVSVTLGMRRQQEKAWFF
jgi:hypothetical protein